MNVFISLGIELGKQDKLEGSIYHVLVGGKKIELTSLQYSVYYLGQMCKFTETTAAEELKQDVQLIRLIVDQLVSMGILMYYDDINGDFFKSHTITPRGNFDSKHSVKSTSFARPSTVNQFTHELWIFSNSNITIDKVFKNLEYYLGYNYRDCCTEATLAIPNLIKEGLIILNPKEFSKEIPCEDFISL